MEIAAPFRRDTSPNRPAGVDVVVGLPEVDLLLHQSRLRRACHVRAVRRIEGRVAALAVRDVDRRRTEADHRLPACRAPRHPVQLPASVSDAAAPSSARTAGSSPRPPARVAEEVDGVLERRQRQAQGLPDARRGQHDRQVLQHLHLGVDHRAGVLEKVSTLFSGEPSMGDRPDRSWSGSPRAGRGGLVGLGASPQTRHAAQSASRDRYPGLGAQRALGSA